ncbi:TonB-dependent receptor [Flammeovirgaceae bacterium SG7u.111]|nr:TonB-dependent receptor [Flammeovirgaceae bacterium SG7u.132]WPO35225.1 TonB-dependent receptor [Flammeovirgaceae bacterium SG7u.111]
MKTENLLLGYKKFTNLFLGLLLTGLVSLFPSSVSAQSRLVNGTVMSEDNLPIPGVNVLVKSTTIGVITNADGKFAINVPQGSTILVISHVGFTSQEVELGDDLQITLKEGGQLLDGVVVTANRTGAYIKDVPQRVEVISAKTIENTVAADLTDVLKKNAGVDVVQYPGMLSGVGIRGFRPQFSGLNQRTLLLIDGRPAAATNLALVDMNNVERVEVLKGPASALYGAQAMGGVINLITKKTRGKISGNAYGGYGSYNTFNFGGSVGGNITEKLDFDASMNYFNQNDDFKMGGGNVFRDAFGWDEATQHFRANDSTATVMDNRGDGETRAHTNYNKIAGALRLGYRLNSNWRIDVKGDMLIANDVNSPGDIADEDKYPGLKDVARNSYDVNVTGKLNQNNELSITGFIGTESSARYEVYESNWTTGEVDAIDPYKSADNTNDWKGFQVKNRTTFGKHLLTVGLDHNNASYTSERFAEDGTGIAPYNPNYAYISTGVYAQAQFNLLNDKLIAQLGARYEMVQYDFKKTDLIENEDRNQDINMFNPSLGLNYKLLPDLSLKATYGKGFTPASVFNVAGYSESSVWGKPGNVNITKGNPDLKNPESATVDLGFTYDGSAKNGFLLSATYFNTKFKNNALEEVTYPTGIELTPAGDTIASVTSYINADKSTLSGLEMNIAFDFGSLAANSYSLRVFANPVFILESKEIADHYGVSEPIETNMHNVAKENINFGIEFDNLKKISVGLTGRYVGNRYDRDWSSYSQYIEIEYPPFMTLDLRAGYRFTPSHEVVLQVANLTDENYYEKRGYNLMGRNFMAKYRFRF